MTQDPSDRRKAPRVSTDLRGQLGDDDAVTCSVKNLSKTGALAVSSHPLDEMAMVQIGVRVTDDDGSSEAFDCEAAVVRCDRRPDGHYDLGLYFTSVKEDAREALTRILERGTLLPSP